MKPFRNFSGPLNHGSGIDRPKLFNFLLRTCLGHESMGPLYITEIGKKGGFIYLEQLKRK